MAFDITEELLVDLSNTSTSNIYKNTRISYDVAFDDMAFFDASSERGPYRRQTAPYRKEQTDDGPEPGEQSLAGWWLRSQSSFHYGAGINFYEPAVEQAYGQAPTVRYMFADSRNVNVWNEGEVTLLKRVNPHDHLVTSSTKTNLRPIVYSGVNAVLMLDAGDVDKVSIDGTTVVHFIDHTTGADTNVYAICDDGSYAYWVTRQASGGTRCEIFKKSLAWTSAQTNTSMYVDNAVITERAVIEYVKGRLIACINNKVYELNPNAIGTGNLPTPLFTHSSSTYNFTDITESPSDIYISGYEGTQSTIFRLALDADGGIPVLASAVTVAEMPRGELIHSIHYYLGYMLIGTSRGVRVAEVQANGSIVYGPLLFNTPQPVYQFATSDRFAWATTRMGLIRIDLSTQIDGLVFAYANDLCVDGDYAECTGVAFAGNSNRIIFTLAADFPYVESATELAESGYITTGKIRFGTSEDKFFKFIKERAEYPAGATISIAEDGINLITVDNSSGNSDYTTFDKNPREYKYFKFTLNVSSIDTTQGPIFRGYQIKALPATRRQRLIQYRLSCFDQEQDKNNVRVGYKGRAIERVHAFEELEATGNVVYVQDFLSKENYNAIVEECSFESGTSPNKAYNNRGGYLTVTVRKI